jgi:hypothetical protein
MQEVWIDSPLGWLAAVDGSTGYTMVERHRVDGWERTSRRRPTAELSERHLRLPLPPPACYSSEALECSMRAISWCTFTEGAWEVREAYVRDSHRASTVADHHTGATQYQQGLSAFGGCQRPGSRPTGRGSRESTSFARCPDSYTVIPVAGRTASFFARPAHFFSGYCRPDQPAAAAS